MPDHVVIVVPSTRNVTESLSEEAINEFTGRAKRFLAEKFAVRQPFTQKAPGYHQRVHWSKRMLPTFSPLQPFYLPKMKRRYSNLQSTCVTRWNKRLLL